MTQTQYPRHDKPLGHLPRDPGAAVNEVLRTIEALREIYVLETNALENTDTKTFLDLQDNKLQTANLYQAQIETLMSRKDELKKINPKLKTQLTAMQKEFSELVSQNKSALERMQKCVTRLGETLRKAAKEAVSKDRAVNYRETGKVEENERKALSMGVFKTA